MLKLLSFLSAVLVSVALTACQNVEPDESLSPQAQTHPFTGCWQSEDGMSREVWVADPSGWNFGYALDRKDDGSVGFFEQMRLEQNGDKSAFVVSAGGNDTVRFERETTDDSAVYKFVNAEHDFPQIITYRPSPGRLDAEISKVDGSNAIPFLKVSCAS